MRQCKPSSLTLHGAAALVGLSALLIFSFGEIRLNQASLISVDLVEADIAIEHMEPLSLTIDISRLNGVAIIDIAQESDEVTYLSVPEVWVKREVRQAMISEVSTDTPVFGFKRYRFPQGAVISFRVPEAPGSIILHNPSTVPVKVRVTNIDLNLDTVERDVFLVQDAAIELF